MGFVEENEMIRILIFVFLNCCLKLQKMKREGGAGGGLCGIEKPWERKGSCWEEGLVRERK